MGRKLFSCILAVALAVLMIPSASIAYAVEGTSDQPGDAENQTFAVTASIGGGTFTGDSTATRGQAYTGTITPSTGHEYPSSIQVTVGSTVLPETDYTYNAENGALVIPGDQITDAITIDAVCTSERYNATNQIANGTFQGSPSAFYGNKYTGTIVPSTGYNRPAEVTVTVSETELKPQDDFSYALGDGKVEVKASSVTGDINIVASCLKIATSISVTMVDLPEVGTVLTQEMIDTAATISCNGAYQVPSSDAGWIDFGIDPTSGGTPRTMAVGDVFTPGHYYGILAVYDIAAEKANAPTVLLNEETPKMVSDDNPFVFSVGNFCQAEIEDDMAGYNGDYSFLTTFEKFSNSYSVSGSITNGSLTNIENAIEGVEYTTSIEPGDHYVRPASQGDVSITVGGSPLAADKYGYDASTGTIAIAGDAVTGNITITAACGAEVYTVTDNIANGSLEGDEQVSYGQAYTATAIPEPGHKYPDTITVAVDGTALTDGYSYSANSGAIEIQAVKITGPITITGECAAETYQVTHTITNGSFEGDETATYYHAYAATIRADEHYVLPETITVTVGGTLLLEGLYEYSPETGALEVLAGKVVGPIKISAVCEPATYAVTGSIENGTFSGAATVTYGQPYTATIAADGHYSLPASITVTVGGSELTDGYTYSSGAIGIDTGKVTGDIEITAACVADTYDVTGTVTDGSFDGDAKATYGKAYTATIAANEHYSLPASITVTVAGTALTDGLTYDSATGAVAIDAAKVTGDIEITAACDAAIHPVQTDAQHGTVTGPNTATYGQEYTATASADTGYSLPAAISIAVGGTELTDGFAYDDQTGAITINGDKITGTVVIAAVCTARTFTVDFEQEGGTAPLASVVATYDSPMPTISGDNLPVREGYEFLGYWTEKNGQGTQYYHADGTSARNWDKASPATLYANWTAHYGILEGAALTHQVGDGKVDSVRINADIAKFLNVYVDGVLVDPANYDVTEGSTIVTYKQSYLDTLSAGVHNARYQFTDGYAESTIAIAAAEKSTPDGSNSGTEIAKTGDSITMMPWLVLTCLIGAAVARLALHREKAASKGKHGR